MRRFRSREQQRGAGEEKERRRRGEGEEKERRRKGHQQPTAKWMHTVGIARSTTLLRRNKGTKVRRDTCMYECEFMNVCTTSRNLNRRKKKNYF